MYKIEFKTSFVSSYITVIPIPLIFMLNWFNHVYDLIVCFEIVETLKFNPIFNDLNECKK